MSDYVNKCIGVNNIKTAVIGATIIDTDSSVGLNVSGNVMTQPRHDNQSIYCPNDALKVYPTVVNTEKEKSDTDTTSAMAAVWFNGFIPYCRGIADPENCCHATANIMSQFGVVSTDQVIKSRPDDWLNCLFSAFKWFGGDEDSRIVPTELQIDTAIGKIVRKGLVHPQWIEKPISIRYLVRELADSESGRDYVYLVGGTDYLLKDDPRETCNIIGDKIRTAQSLINNGDNEIPREIANNSEINDPHRVWAEINLSKYSDDFKANSFVKGKILAREVNRAIQGIIMIRNYFVYARNHLKVEKVVDINFNKSEDPVKVPVDEVIERYNDAYRFVRNLCNCEEYIGNGKLA